MPNLTLLVEGCHRHPPYRGKNPPVNDCPTCQAIWVARQEFHAAESEPAFAPHHACLLCMTNRPHTTVEHWKSIAQTLEHLLIAQQT
jgi:hypothetical protein